MESQNIGSASVEITNSNVSSFMILLGIFRVLALKSPNSALLKHLLWVVQTHKMPNHQLKRFYGFLTHFQNSNVKYSIIASEVLRPSTIYQVLVSLASDSASCRVVASISRDGVSISSNEVKLDPSETQPILLKVPPNNSGQSYFLRLEGHRLNQGGLVFQRKVQLDFRKEFLSITISTSRYVKWLRHE